MKLKIALFWMIIFLKNYAMFSDDIVFFKMEMIYTFLTPNNFRKK